jgi:hypothetical protein
VQSLPRATRVAMLDGLDSGPIIVGAYTSGDGVCPMLAAHRAGGRCNAAFFADAWDRFAFRDGRGRRAAARRASERELRILRAHLEASLLDEELGDATLAGALHEHRALLARRPLARRPATAEQAPAAVAGPEPGTTRVARPRPGDRDRAPELRLRPGWAWSRLFRRYDEYAAALAHLQAVADTDEPSDQRSTRGEPANV